MVLAIEAEDVWFPRNARHFFPSPTSDDNGHDNQKKNNAFQIECFKCFYRIRKYKYHL